MSLGIVQFGIEGPSDSLAFRNVLDLVFCSAEEPRGFGDDPRVVEVVCGRGDDLRSRRFVRDVVAQSDAVRAGLGLSGQIVDVAAVLIVQSLSRRRITIVQVQIVGNDEKRAVPGRAVAPRVAPATCRHDSRQFAVGLLLVGHVVEPLFVDGDRIVIPQRRLAGQVRIGHPAVLLAVRAIGGDAVQIAQVRPPRSSPRSDSAVDWSTRSAPLRGRPSE